MRKGILMGGSRDDTTYNTRTRDVSYMVPTAQAKMPPFGSIFREPRTNTVGSSIKKLGFQNGDSGRVC